MDTPRRRAAPALRAAKAACATRVDGAVGAADTAVRGDRAAERRHTGAWSDPRLAPPPLARAAAMTRVALVCSRADPRAHGRDRHPLSGVRAAAAARRAGDRAGASARAPRPGAESAGRGWRRAASASSIRARTVARAARRLRRASWRRASSPTTWCSSCPSCRWRSTSTIPGWSRTCTTRRTLGLDPYRNDHATWVLADVARGLLPVLVGGAAPVLPRVS